MDLPQDNLFIMKDANLHFSHQIDDSDLLYFSTIFHTSSIFNEVILTTLTVVIYPVRHCGYTQAIDPYLSCTKFRKIHKTEPLQPYEPGTCSLSVRIELPPLEHYSVSLK
jgi:hypothetical protein